MQAEERSLMLLEQVASQRGQTDIVAEAGEARRALAAGSFNVAFIGQFKRGKSTLINALLGRELLPMDVAPVTTVITVVVYGPVERAMVRFPGGQEQEIELTRVGQYVSEEENPGNRKDVRAVFIELPSPLLASGLCLVDTPGVGSVFEGNSQITLRFLPRIDVAVVVLGSDPPISGEELALIRTATLHVRRVCYVLNKSDRVREATRTKAASFTRKVLCDALGRDPGSFIHASAFTALRDGEDPGVTILKHEIADLVADSGRDLARESAARASRQLAAHLLQQLDIETAALITPIEDLEHRIQRFEAAIRDVDDLALAVSTRVKAGFTYDWKKWESTEEEFTLRARAEIVKTVMSRLDRRTASSHRVLRQAAKDIGCAETKIRVDRWHKLGTDEFQRLRRHHIQQVSDETNRLIDRVASAAADAFGIPVVRFELGGIALPTRAMTFEFHEPSMALDINTWLTPILDLVSTRKALIRRACRHTQGLVVEWLQRNLYEVDRHLVDWIDALVKELESAMRSRLNSMRREVFDAIQEGRRRREAGEEAVKDQLAAIEKQRRKIADALLSLPSPHQLRTYTP